MIRSKIKSKVLNSSHQYLFIEQERWDKNEMAAKK